MARIIQKATTLEGYVGQIGELCSHEGLSVINFLLSKITILEQVAAGIELSSLSKEGQGGFESQKGYFEVDVSVWGTDALDVNRVLTKGTHVVVQGVLEQETYTSKHPETKGGAKAQFSLTAERVSLSLRPIQSVNLVESSDIADQGGEVSAKQSRVLEWSAWNSRQLNPN